MAYGIGPTLDQVRSVDEVLTNLVNLRMNEEKAFIADQATPPIYTEGVDSGTVSVVNTGLRSAGNIEVERGVDSPYTRVGFQPGTTTFNCREYGAEAAIDSRLRAASQVGMDLVELAALRVMAEALIQRELRWVAAFFGTGDWTAEQTLGAAAQWDDAGGVPLQNIWTAKRTVELNGGVRANAAVIGYDAFRVATLNGDITGLMPADTRQSMVSFSELQRRLGQVFEIDEMLVGRASRNTSNLNVAEVLAFVLTDNLLVFHKEPAGSVNAGAGAQFASTDGGAPTVTDRYYRDDTRQWVVRVRETRDELVIDGTKGYLTIDCAN